MMSLTALLYLIQKNLKKTDLYLAFVRKNSASTVKANFSKIHSLIDSQKPSGKSQLIWVRWPSKMFGRLSTPPAFLLL